MTDATAPHQKPQMSRMMRYARIAAIAWVAKIVLTAIVYAVAEHYDVEKVTLNDSTRAAIKAAQGGAFVKLADGVTYYEQAGPDSAPVVVLAAGASVPGYIWQPTFDTLRANGYHVIRYDYYGRGASDRPDIPMTQEVYVRQLDGLLDSLHVTKPIALAGLSYGGTVITSYAAARPNRVGALIYTDPAILTPRPIPFYIKYDIFGGPIYQYQSKEWASGQSSDFLHPEKFPDWPSRYEPQMKIKGFRRSRLSYVEANSTLDMRPVLAEVGKHPRPVLVIWGKQDPTVPFQASEALLAAVPRAKLAAIDSSGHLPQWEQPGVTHAALLSFLRENKDNISRR